MDLAGSRLWTFHYALGYQFLRASPAAARDDYCISYSHIAPIWLDYDSQMVTHNLA